MEYDATEELRRELAYRLEKELRFYRSLYVLVERQRDAAQRGAEADIVLSYGELDAIMGGLKESQFAIAAMREKEPELFIQASQKSPIPEMVNQARDILSETHKVLKQGTDVLRKHCKKIQDELARLGQEQGALHAYAPPPGTGQMLDGTR